MDLTRCNVTEKSGIEADKVEVGMSKDAVTATLGYPPKHKTPALKGNQSRYWHNRFNIFIVHFKDDKVTSIQE